MRTTWPTVGLHDICRPKQWKTITSSELTTEGFLVYGANGPIGRYHSYNHEDPTILIGCRGSCGSVTVSEPRSWVTGNAMALDELDTSVIDFSYLVFALRFDGLASAVTGTSQPQITQTTLRRIAIPLPPIEEQLRIASILNAADALRTKRRQALAKLDTLKQSIFIDMFGDTFLGDKDLPSLSEVTQRITYGFTSPMSHHESGIPILTAKNIRSGWIDYSTCDHADQAEFGALTSKSKPKDGDVLVTKDGTIGRYAVFVGQSCVCINQSVALIRPDPSVLLSSFLAGWIGSVPVQRRLAEMKKGNAIAHLQISELSEMRIPLPPVNQQTTFHDRTSALQDATLGAQAALTLLDGLFGSLQHRAFRGDL